MKKEREILWTKPIPKGLKFDNKDLITLTKAEEENLFSGKLNIEDVLERAKKEEKKLFAGKLKHKDITTARVASKAKPKTKRKVVITKGKK